MELSARWLQPLCAAWVDMTLAALVGIVAVRGAVPASATIRLARLARLTTAFLAAGVVAFLSVATLAMTDPGLAGFASALWQVQSQSHFGDMAWVALLAWIALMGATCLPAAVRTSWRQLANVLGALDIAALVYSRAATGHAADYGLMSAAELTHAVHIAAACAWAGSGGVCARLAPAWRSWSLQQRSDLAHQLSTTATFAVPAVAAGGRATVLLARDHSMLPGDSVYLDLVFAKIALVLMAVALGAWNCWSWMASMDKGRSDGTQGLYQVLVVETFVLAGALLLAAKPRTTMEAHRDTSRPKKEREICHRPLDGSEPRESRAMKSNVRNERYPESFRNPV